MANMRSGNSLGSTATANIHGIPFLCSWGVSQSVPRNIKCASGLAGLQTSGNSF